MSRYRKITTICCAAVFALGLSACGGGDDGISVADRDAAVKAAVEAEQEKTKALQMQLAALRAELGLGPEDDPVTEIQALEAEIMRLQGLVTAANEKERMEQEEADRMAAAKTGMELFAALAHGTDDTTNALNHITSTDLASSGLMINDIASRLKAGGSAGSLGSWSGMNYAHTDAAGVMNEAVVYTNRGASKTQSFVEKYGDGSDYKPSTRTLMIDTDADKNLIKASAFPTAGNQVFTGAQDIVGTYDGAMGRYKCETGCSAAYETAGIALGGTWTFVHDAGAMVSNPDANYLYYGWWVNKAKGGMPEMASAFADMVGDVDGAGTTTAGGASLTGSAMYAGHAAGKFALDYSKNKLLDGASDGGHFTADVMLSAKFGPTGDDKGMTGTIDNFMANGESVPWSVALHRATWGNDGEFAAASNGTTWSIDGTSAPKSGEWKGNMYDEMPGNASDGGDGSNVPTTVTGTFYSQFDKVGRMVGAFGANKQ